jgi:hypothetical protein
MDTFRFTLAFLIAPLAIPAIEFAPWKFLPFEYNFLVVLPITAIAYGGTFLFGIPAYFFLRARKWTAFGFAPVAGFVVAALVWWLVGLFAIWRGGDDLLDAHRHLDWLRRALWPFGPIGAFVASLLWLLARLERAQEP